MWRDLIGGAGAVLVAGGSAYYVVDVVRGNTRPHRASWAVWALIGVLGFGATTSAGAGPGAWGAGVYTVAYVVTFGLSLFPRYGKPGGERYDGPLCLAAIAGVLLWHFGSLSDGSAVTLSIVCDGAALWPTLRDSWRDPGSESLRSWGSETAGNLLILTAVASGSWASVGYPVYLLVATLAVSLTLAVSSARVRQRRTVLVAESDRVDVPA